MQIQRIQTIWLIIALCCAITSLCFPWIEVGTQAFGVQNNVILLVITLLATLLPLLGIFSYRNLRRQKQICALGALMALVCLGFVVAWAQLGPDDDAKVSLLAPVMMAVSGIFDVLARRAVVHDENLLKAADRIR